MWLPWNVITKCVSNALPGGLEKQTPVHVRAAFADPPSEVPQPRPQQRQQATQSRTLARDITESIVATHFRELNDYVAIKQHEMVGIGSSRQQEKIKEIVDWNIRVMAARVKLYYEAPVV